MMHTATLTSAPCTTPKSLQLHFLDQCFPSVSLNECNSRQLVQHHQLATFLNNAHYLPTDPDSFPNHDLPAPLPLLLPTSLPFLSEWKGLRGGLPSPPPLPNGNCQSKLDVVSLPPLCPPQPPHDVPLGARHEVVVAEGGKGSLSLLQTESPGKKVTGASQHFLCTFLTAS